MRPLYIFSGGPGSEHDVSLASGKNLFEAAQKVTQAFFVVLEKSGEWTIDDIQISFQKLVEKIQTENGIVFPIIHGTFGEDGGLAELLEAHQIPFVGSGSEILKRTIDKQKTGDFLNVKNIRTPRSRVISNVFDLEEGEIVFPCIVKPKDEGSSVSLYKIYAKAELVEALQKELAVRKEILVQEFVSGREFTCGVIELDGELLALPPSEIILTKGDIFNYEAKYSIGGCNEITPAEISDDLREEIQNLAIRTHEICGCRDISRTDIILNDAGELVVLEINTLPGMTNTSFIPAELQAAGLSLEVFLESMMRKYSVK